MITKNINIIRDFILMKQISQGNEKAFKKVIQTYSGKMTSLSYSILYDLNAAKEICQDTFLKLWIQSANWKMQAKISTWLYRVTVNACLGRLNQKREVFWQDFNRFPDKRILIENKYLLQEKEETLKEVLTSLPKRQRLVISLIYYKHMTLRQVADIIGISKVATESLLARAKKRLKKKVLSKYN